MATGYPKLNKWIRFTKVSGHSKDTGCPKVIGYNKHTGSHCDPPFIAALCTHFVPPHFPSCIVVSTMQGIGLRAIFSTMPKYGHVHIRSDHHLLIQACKNSANLLECDTPTLHSEKKEFTLRSATPDNAGVQQHSALQTNHIYKALTQTDDRSMSLSMLVVVFF